MGITNDGGISRRALVGSAALLGALPLSSGADGQATENPRKEVGALLVVEPQMFIYDEPYVEVREIVRRISVIADAFRERRSPVFILKITENSPGRGRTQAAIPAHITSPGWTNIIPELGPRSGDIVLTKPRWGGFIGTTLDYDLRQRGITQVFVTGIATSIGVESTAREGYDCGYNVVPIVDAMTDRTVAEHRHSIEKIFPRLGVPAEMKAVLTSLRSEK